MNANEYDGSLRRDLISGKEYRNEMREDPDKRKGYYNVQQVLYNRYAIVIAD